MAGKQSTEIATRDDQNASDSDESKSKISAEIATRDDQTLTSLGSFHNTSDSDESKSKDSAFQPARTGGMAKKKKKNMTEAEKKARWPPVPVDRLPAVKPSDKEVIAIAKARNPKRTAGMPLGIWRHTQAPHAFGYRGRLLEAYYHICDRQADGSFLLEEWIQKKLVNNYPSFRKSRDAGNIYTTKGPRQATPRLFTNRRDEKGRFRKALMSEQGQELSKYGIEKTLLHTYDVNKDSKAWLAGADNNQKSRLSKVRERANIVQMDAVRERVKMREEGALMGKKLLDAQQKLKKEKEKFEREKEAFWATMGSNEGAGGEVGNATTGGNEGAGGEVGNATTGGNEGAGGEVGNATTGGNMGTEDANLRVVKRDHITTYIYDGREYTLEDIKHLKRQVNATARSFTTGGTMGTGGR